MDFYPPGFLVADYADLRLQVTPTDHSNLMAQLGPKRALRGQYFGHPDESCEHAGWNGN
jgi:hypothetical protein